MKKFFLLIRSIVNGHPDSYRESTLIFIFALICQSSIVNGQNYFRSPLDIPLKLSGNFGEIRSNHFHSGLDIKTDSVEGKNVYNVADGYVSRIKVSAFGYGNALYIMHPNGYVSVYGHLQKYIDTIANYVMQNQTEKQSFEVDLFPDSNLLRFHKGDVIAFSGNSGGSAGPHLHFEIRDAKTEKIINPMQFGFEIHDTIPPRFNSLCIYEQNNLRYAESSFDQLTHIEKLAGKWVTTRHLTLKDTLITTPDAQFGYEADDYSDVGLNKLGIYSVQFTVDDTVIWNYTFQTFAFDETRYVNAHIDYAEKIMNKNIVERCFRLPGDSFSVYASQPPLQNNSYSPEKLHHALFILRDYTGNTTLVEFYFKSTLKKSQSVKRNKSWVHLEYNKPYNLKTKNFLLQLSAKALYNDIDLKYHVTKKTSKLYSKIYHINDNAVPLHIPATISIKASRNFGMKTKEEQDKALIVMVNDDGTYSNMGGMYKNGYIRALIRTLGNYAIAIDTTPPNVIWQNANDTLSKSDTLCFLIEDDLSGISKYKATVNGEPIVAAYDAKNDLLKINCIRFKEGEQVLKVLVTDVKGNFYEFSNKVFIKPNN